jgi:hypothetical protein
MDEIRCSRVAYLVHIAWEKQRRQLEFQEPRADAKDAMKGSRQRTLMAATHKKAGPSVRRTAPKSLFMFPRAAGGFGACGHRRCKS